MIKILVHKFLKTNLFNSFYALGAASYFMLSLLVMKMVVDPEQAAASMYFGVVLISLLFTMLGTSNLLLEDDHDKGLYAQLLLTGVHDLRIIFSYVIAYCVFYGLILCIMLPIALLFFPELLAFSVVMISALILVVVNISTVLLLLKALTLSLRSNILLAVIAIPLLVPTLIFASMTIYDHYNLLLLFGLMLIILPISVLLSNLSLRNSF